MSRNLVAGTTADFTYRPSVRGPDKLMALAPGSVVTIWSAKVGGVQYTDLLAADGVTPITSVTSDNNGQIPAFWTPDDVVEFWLQGTGNGGRVRMVASPVDAVANAQEAASAAAGSAASSATSRDQAQTYAQSAAASVVTDNGDGTASISSPLVSVDDAGVAHFVAPSGTSLPQLDSAGHVGVGQLPVAATGRTGSRVALLGASITYNNGNSSLQVNPGAGNPSGWVHTGIFSWANALMGQPCRVVANVSHGGYTSAQILAQVGAALAAGPDFVLGHDWWINDIAGGVPAATSQANIEAIIAACNKAGVTAVLTDYLPIAAYTTTAMVAQHFAMMDWAQARQDRGFVFVPVSDSIVDIATGRPLAGMTTDGTHPSPKGARAMGKLLADRAGRLFAGGSRQPVAWSAYAGSGVVGNPNELVANPMPNANVGAGTPTFYAVSGSGAPAVSVVQATDYPNLRWMRVTFGADGVIAITPGVQSGAGLTYGDLVMVPGVTKTRLGLEFRIPSASAAGKWASVSAYQYYTGAASTVYAMEETSSVGTDTGFPADDTAIYTLRSPDALMPVGATAIAAAIVLYGQAGAVVDIRRTSLAVVS